LRRAAIKEIECLMHFQVVLHILNHKRPSRDFFIRREIVLTDDVKILEDTLQVRLISRYIHREGTTECLIDNNNVWRKVICWWPGDYFILQPRQCLDRPSLGRHKGKSTLCFVVTVWIAGFSLGRLRHFGWLGSWQRG